MDAELFVCLDLDRSRYGRDSFVEEEEVKEDSCCGLETLVLGGCGGPWIGFTKARRIENRPSAKSRGTPKSLLLENHTNF